MDGMHDVGGMSGFGSIPIEDNEPVFHGDWEGKSFAVASGMWLEFERRNLQGREPI